MAIVSLCHIEIAVVKSIISLRIESLDWDSPDGESFVKGAKERNSSSCSSCPEETRKTVLGRLDSRICKRNRQNTVFEALLNIGAL